MERTGWGKSFVYFISARILRDKGQGPTLIVSPLLALMRNQVDAADGLGIKAVSITSDNRSQWPAARQSILTGEADILLISPERLANDEFVDEVLLPLGQRVGLLVVDEAHCISDWGHDFRPDYRRIASVLARMRPNLPILGTTATANNRVIQDVQEQLGKRPNPTRAADAPFTGVADCCDADSRCPIGLACGAHKRPAWNRDNLYADQARCAACVRLAQFAGGSG